MIRTLSGGKFKNREITRGKGNLKTKSEMLAPVNYLNTLGLVFPTGGAFLHPAMYSCLKPVASMKPKGKKGCQNETHRAGDWVCILCHNLNYSFRKVCNRCQAQTKRENLLQSLTMLKGTGEAENELDTQDFKHQSWCSQETSSTVSPPSFNQGGDLIEQQPKGLIHGGFSSSQSFIRPKTRQEESPINFTAEKRFEQILGGDIETLPASDQPIGKKEGLSSGKLSIRSKRNELQEDRVSNTLISPIKTSTCLGIQSASTQTNSLSLRERWSQKERLSSPPGLENNAQVGYFIKPFFQGSPAQSESSEAAQGKIYRLFQEQTESNSSSKAAVGPEVFVQGQATSLAVWEGAGQDQDLTVLKSLDFVFEDQE